MEQQSERWTSWADRDPALARFKKVPLGAPVCTAAPARARRVKRTRRKTTAGR